MVIFAVTVFVVIVVAVRVVKLYALHIAHRKGALRAVRLGDVEVARYGATRNAVSS